MKILLISDLHFDDGVAHEYKWNIFNKIKSIKNKTPFDALFILGDLTDKKDRHSGRLVNRIVGHIMDLNIPTWILRGNHDGLDPDYPYFDFLNYCQDIRFIKEIEFDYDEEYFKKAIAFYPHGTADQYKEIPDSISFFHQTFRGVLYENGQIADNEELVLPQFGSLCFSGDIHEPQQVGDVIYIGSPYHTRYGDSFNPRVILLDTTKNSYVSIPTDMPKKITLEIASIEDFNKKISKYLNDMVRIQIQENDISLKVYTHITERLKEFPNIQSIQMIKEEAIKFQPIKATSYSHKELINTYGKNKEVEDIFIEKGIAIHENS